MGKWNDERGNAGKPWLTLTAMMGVCRTFTGKVRSPFAKIEKMTVGMAFLTVLFVATPMTPPGNHIKYVI